MLWHVGRRKLHSCMFPVWAATADAIADEQSDGTPDESDGTSDNGSDETFDAATVEVLRHDYRALEHVRGMRASRSRRCQHARASNLARVELYSDSFFSEARTAVSYVSKPLRESPTRWRFN